MFSRVQLVDGSSLDAGDVERHSLLLEQLVVSARDSNSDFKMPSLASTQVYFQTKFRESEPMKAVLDGFNGPWALAGHTRLPHSYITRPTFLSTEFFKVTAKPPPEGLPPVDNSALTRQNSAKSAGGAPSPRTV
jgi:hypothetical protein